MFSENKKDRQNQLSNSSSQNIIAKGTHIKGNFVSEGGLRIDGTLEGDIKTKGKIVVGKTGFVKGNIEGVDAYFEGKFSGNLNLSKTLTLKASAHIEGEVVLGKLEVEPGATFNVNCSMKGTVKEMHKGEQKNQQESTEKYA